MTPVEQTNNSCGLQPSRFAASATVRSAAGGAVRVAGVHHHGAHAAFRDPQVFLGDENRCGDDKILREDGGRRSRHVARKNGEIERPGFLQAASGRGEAKPARQRGFRRCVLYQRNVRVPSAPFPEGTSDPPQPQRGRIGVSLLGLRSWFGSCFGGFFVELSFQIGDGVAYPFWCGAAGNFFRGKGSLNAEALCEINFKDGRDFLETL